MKVEQLTCNIGAELIGVNLADAIHDEGLFAEIRAQLLTIVWCSCATRTSAVPSTWPSPGASASWRITRWPAAIRITRAWCRSTKPDQPMDRYENAWHTDATWREHRPWVRAALRGVPAGGRRHHVGEHGRGLRQPAR
jgi:taurine dioxygenase